MNVAQTILQQLGGNRFLAMTGAKHLVSDGNTLQFKLPAGARGGVNFVRITLTDDDRYDAAFYKLRGLNLTPVASHEGIYADGLAALFTEATGLDTQL